MVDLFVLQVGQAESLRAAGKWSSNKSCSSTVTDQKRRLEVLKGSTKHKLTSQGIMWTLWHICHHLFQYFLNSVSSEEPPHIIYEIRMRRPVQENIYTLDWGRQEQCQAKNLIWSKLNSINQWHLKWKILCCCIDTKNNKQIKGSNIHNHAVIISIIFYLEELISNQGGSWRSHQVRDTLDRSPVTAQFKLLLF